MKINITQRESGCLIDIKVIPKSSKNIIDSIVDGRLLIRVCVAPENGKANEMVLKLVSKFFKIKKSDSSIFLGHKSQLKTVYINNITASKLLSALTIFGAQ